jgi:hypothetical protein
MSWSFAQTQITSGVKSGDQGWFSQGHLSTALNPHLPIALPLFLHKPSFFQPSKASTAFWSNVILKLSEIVQVIHKSVIISIEIPCSNMPPLTTSVVVFQGPLNTV